MAEIILLDSHIDNRGKLTVLEKKLPFSVQRIYYIYDVDNAVRGGHRHHNTIQAAICIKGSCKFYCNDSYEENIILLDTPDKCLIIDPLDWHEMFEFSNDAILIVFASELYNKEDYIYEPYPNSLRRPKVS